MCCMHPYDGIPIDVFWDTVSMELVPRDIYRTSGTGIHATPVHPLASILPYKYTKLSNKLWNYQGCLCSCKTNVFFFRLRLELWLGGTKNALLSHVFDAHQPPLLSCNRQQTGVVYMPWTQLFAPAAKFNRHEAIRGRQIFQNPVIVTS